MQFKIKPMLPEHYQQVYRLWTSIEGMDMSDADDNFEAISAFLAFNPDLNYIAEINDKVVGVIMCGFDGRRATLYHAAVDPDYQKQGIGFALSEHLESALKTKGISKGRLLAFKSNEKATLFWQKAGWTLQQKLNYFSKKFI
ncbi:GNAT family N-acetyltransferase [Basfia succiniciproducens]|uniref:GNAT family N-acetyltransferase n=1 Tax=Basfia succiniciproducens TaxID=653940 RepID=UPI0008C3BFC1|nr:GNAT family N-acetyltransferase [Basfia succiniciproducens]SEQ05119.1 Ribosomal protein S18 acetylase RimI [Basfia succiniciproducens]